MVDIGGINDWDTAGLERLSSSLTSRISTLIDLGDQLDRIGLIDGWVGEASEVARRAFDAIVDHLTDSAAQVGAIKRLTDDTEDSVMALKRALAEVSSLAFANDFAVCNDNTLWDRWAFERPANQTDAEAADRQRMKVEILERVSEIVRRGTEIEENAAAIMTAAARNLISDNGSTDVREALGIGDDQGATKAPQPPAQGHPAENNQWWNSLTDDQRDYVREERPHWIGDLDGIPAADRSTANLARLDLDRSSIDGQVNEAQARFDQTGSAMDEKRLQLALDKRSSLDAVEHLLFQTGTDGNFVLGADGQRIPFPDRQLLAFDASPERTLATAVVATGDIDSADHVSVHTPGFTSTVDGGLENLVQDSDRIRRLSQWQLDHYSPDVAGQTVASVAYMGYEAPQNVGVLSDDMAQTGGGKLASFLDGIDASRSDDPHLTAVGHSYGSLTTGFALQDGTGVDDAVFMGSPGVGTDNLGALHITGDAYTLASGGDGVAALAAFDGDPREITGVHDLSTRAADVVMPDGTDVALMSTDRFTGPVVERMGSHSDYYKLDTTSQFNQAAVIAGIPDVAVAR
ncbi:alpha/beta hydrolase [Rhodococcus sp. IEGM 1381]|uniref:alpha/beta hydrolase n=1 Tax=Rhodococcus sp. IEGM 1381 TaxID=3047085 RepID=UPI0024B83711|nr:alpha/beta hydrolase [Rhodococcus sp. IEGM 1381]MDI9894250.1 alpha/beta hydrolase [Rhodococcus sp. IEGM 1381]